MDIKQKQQEIIVQIESFQILLLMNLCIFGIL